MPSKSELLTSTGAFAVHQVESLGNQSAVIDGSSIFVVDTGSTNVNVGIALAALGAALDLGHLAWPALEYGFGLSATLHAWDGEEPLPK